MKHIRAYFVVLVALLLLNVAGSNDTERFLKFIDAARNLWKFKKVLLIRLVNVRSFELSKFSSFFVAKEARWMHQHRRYPNVDQVTHLAHVNTQILDGFTVFSSVQLSGEVLMSLSRSGLFERNIWFVPEVRIPADLKLRLDSKLFLFNETTEGTYFSEVYAIKGETKYSF